MNPILECFSRTEVGGGYPAFDVDGGAWYVGEDGKSLNDCRLSRLAVPLRVISEQDLTKLGVGLLLKASFQMPDEMPSNLVWDDIARRRPDLPKNSWKALTRDHGLPIEADELLAVPESEFVGAWVCKGSTLIYSPSHFSSGLFVMKSAPIFRYQVKWRTRHDHELQI